MIKVISIYIVSYFIVLILLLFILPISSRIAIILLSLATLVLGVLITCKILSHQKRDNKALFSEIIRTNIQKETIDLNVYKKISSKVGVFKSAVNEITLYYSLDNLCVVYPDNTNVYYPIKDIVDLRRTSTKIGNSSVWSLSIRVEAEVVTYRFIHNVRLWNRDFVSFYKLLMVVNPKAVKSAWSW